MPSLRALAGLGALLSARAQYDDVSLVQAYARTGANRSAYQPPPEYEQASAAPATPKTWMLMYNELTTTEQLATLCKELLGEDAKCKYSGHPSEGGLPIVIITATEQALQSMPSLRAEHMEADEPTHLIAPVSQEVERGNHPLREEIWGLDRINGREGLDHDDTIEGDGEGIDIFSVDTGVDCGNPDFDGRAVPAVDFAIMDPTVSYIECAMARPEDECAHDKNGHGTHTAGIAASKTFGVAKKAKVHAVKVLSDAGSGMWSWFVGALDWTVAYVKAQSIKQAVITASLGGMGPVDSVTKAVNSATAAGISVVVAAGNEFADACAYLPAQVEKAITVGSTDEFDQMSYFSNYGACIDIFAPGSHILSLGLDGTPVAFSGTSMAAPFVAGAAALIFAQSSDTTPEVVDTNIGDTSSLGCIQGLPLTTPNKFLYVGPESDQACAGSLAASGAPAVAGDSLDMSKKEVVEQDPQEWIQAASRDFWSR